MIQKYILKQNDTGNIIQKHNYKMFAQFLPLLDERQLVSFTVSLWT